MNKLTDKQRLVMLAIQKYIEDNKYPPSVRELCKLTEISSTATIQYHLNNLRDKGYIESDVHRYRSIRILKKIK